MTVDFNKVFITTQSTAKWELQQRKDVINTKNHKKQHTENLLRYMYGDKLRDT